MRTALWEETPVRRLTHREQEREEALSKYHLDDGYCPLCGHQGIKQGERLLCPICRVQRGKRMNDGRSRVCLWSSL